MALAAGHRGQADPRHKAGPGNDKLLDRLLAQPDVERGRVIHCHLNQHDMVAIRQDRQTVCDAAQAGRGQLRHHYENKVLGFCSPECKNEFAKNPKANLAAAEMK